MHPGHHDALKTKNGPEGKQGELRVPNSMLAAESVREGVSVFSWGKVHCLTSSLLVANIRSPVAMCLTVEKKGWNVVAYLRRNLPQDEWIGRDPWQEVQRKQWIAPRAQ